MELQNNPMHTSKSKSNNDNKSLLGNNNRKTIIENVLENELYTNNLQFVIRIEDNDSLEDEKRRNYLIKIENSDKIPIFYDLFLDKINFSLFIKQLLIHVCFPLFNELSDSKQFQYLKFDLSLAYFYELLPRISIIISVTIYIYVWFHFNHGDSYYDLIIGSIFTPLYIYILQKFLVALKWASLSNNEYNILISSNKQKVMNAFFQQFNLLSVWYNNRSNDIIEHEILDAAISVGAKLNSLYIRIENPENSDISCHNFLKYKALMLEKPLEDIDLDIECSDMVLQEDGDYIVSLFCYLRQLTKYIDRQPKYKQFKTSHYWIKLAVVLLYIGGWVPKLLFFRDIIHNSFDVLFIIYFVALGNVVFGSGQTVLVFSLQAVNSTLKILDSYYILHEVIKLPTSKLSSKYNTFRHEADLLFENFNSSNCSDFYHNFDSTNKSIKNTQKKKNSILSFRSSIKEIDKLKEYNEYLDLPVLFFSGENNVLAWTFARLIYLNFGTRFIKRSENFVAVSVAYAVIFIIISLVRATILSQDCFELLSFMKTTFFIHTLALFTVTLALLILLTLVGALINFQLLYQKSTILDHITHQTKRIVHTKNINSSSFQNNNEELNKKIRDMKNCISSLKICLNAVSTQNEVKPFLILGLNPKNLGLTISIATFSGYIYFALFKLYSNCN